MKHDKHKNGYYVIRRDYGAASCYLRIDGWEPGEDSTICQAENAIISWGEKHMRAEWHPGSPDQVVVRIGEKDGKPVETSGWVVGFDTIYFFIKIYGGNLCHVDRHGKETLCDTKKEEPYCDTNSNLGVQYPVEMVIDDELKAYVNVKGHYIIKNGDDYMGITSNGAGAKSFGKIPCRHVPDFFVYWTPDKKYAAEWHAGSPDRIIIKDDDGKVAAGCLGDTQSIFLIMREHGGHLVWVSRKEELSEEKYIKQLNVKLSEKDIDDMENINREFFEGEATQSMMGRILLRKGISFYNKLKKEL